MRLIYKDFSRCLIWLGEIVEEGFTIQDAQEVFNFLEIIADPDEHATATEPAICPWGPVGRTARTAFRAMLEGEKSWWNRIWTIQEAILPPRAMAMWRSLVIEWHKIEAAAHNLHNRRLPDAILKALLFRPDPTTTIEIFQYPVLAMSVSRKGESPVNLLRQWRYRAATDPRDKIYALLRLFPSNPFPHVQSCSYETDASQLYARVTFDLIQIGKSLHPLIGIRGEPQVTLGLPTWAVDMTTHYTKRPLLKWWNHCHRYGRFTADRGLKMVCSSRDVDTVLSLQGVYIDTIAEVGPVFHGEAGEILADELLIQSVENWRQLLHSVDRVLNLHEEGGQPEDAFWRTMLGDLIMEELTVDRVRPSDKKLLDAFLQHGIVNGTYYSLRDMLYCQAFFITQSGHIGMGPPTKLPGDEAWVLLGGNVPYILRPKNRAKGWKEWRQR